jgi:hypothetical protein
VPTVADFPARAAVKNAGTLIYSNKGGSATENQVHEVVKGILLFRVNVTHNLLNKIYGQVNFY